MNRRGWALAEFAIAFTVVAGALFATVFALQGQVRDTRRLYDRAVAREFVHSQLEAVRAMNREQVLALDGQPGPVALASVRNLHEAVSRVKVSSRADVPGALDVTITLDWLELDGGAGRASLSGVWTPREDR